VNTPILDTLRLSRNLHPIPDQRSSSPSRNPARTSNPARTFSLINISNLINLTRTTNLTHISNTANLTHHTSLIYIHNPTHVLNLIRTFIAARNGKVGPMTGAAARPEPAQPAATAPSRLPPGVTRIRVLRDDNDGLRSDFADVQAALAAVERHMRRHSVYSIMIIFDA
jgi:hypothetical protein